MWSESRSGAACWSWAAGSLAWLAWMALARLGSAVSVWSLIVMGRAPSWRGLWMESASGRLCQTEA